MTKRSLIQLEKSLSALPLAQPMPRRENVIPNCKSCALDNLDSMYNLACYLTASQEVAETVVLDAMLRAQRRDRSFSLLQDMRIECLALVREQCFRLLDREPVKARRQEGSVDNYHVVRSPESKPKLKPGIVSSTLIGEPQAISECIKQLPFLLREVIILKDIEDLSYREIAAVTGVPRCVVRLRLASARKQLAL